jgi:hypothetical protein
MDERDYPGFLRGRNWEAPATPVVLEQGGEARRLIVFVIRERFCDAEPAHHLELLVSEIPDGDQPNGIQEDGVHGWCSL